MHQNSHLVCLASLLVALSAQAARAQCTFDVVHDEPFVGVSGGVRAFATHDDGRGFALFIGGAFTHVAGDRMPAITRWDGSSFSPVGTGLTGSVHALATYNGVLVAGGRITSPDSYGIQNIAYWDGVRWQAFDSGLNGQVEALAVFNNELIATGEFTSGSNRTLSRIARWDGQDWQALGSGLSHPGRGLTIYQGELVVVGDFTTAGGVSANRVARWNGTQWSALGTGLDRAAMAATAASGQLLVGGSFTTAGGVSSPNIASWNGTTWSAAGRIEGGVTALRSGGGRVYAGGWFSGRIAERQHGNSWWTVGGGLNENYVAAIGLFDGQIYAGGDFYYSGRRGMFHLARFDGIDWQPLGEGWDAPPSRLARYGDQLIAAGRFTVAPGVRASSIAAWNGERWQALGQGVNAQPNLLVPYGDELIVGGPFTMAGDRAIARLARWNGVEWQSLGTGVSGTPRAAAVTPDGLVVWGISSADGRPLNGLGRWDGAAWQPMPAPPGDVADLALFGGHLVALGEFEEGEYPNRVRFGAVLLDGATWRRLGDLPYVYEGRLVATTGALYSIARHWDGTRDRLMARWDGAAWSYIDLPEVDAIRAARAAGADLLLALSVEVGNGSVERLARWNGAELEYLTEGVTASATDLEFDGDQIVVSGEAWTPDRNRRQVLRRFAIASGAPEISQQPQARATPDGRGYVLAIEAEGAALEFQWRRDGAPLADGGRFSGARAAQLTISEAQPEDSGAYTVQIANRCGAVVSRAVVVAVSAPCQAPMVRATASATDVPEGGAVEVNAVAAGTGPLSFQWRRDGAALHDDGRIRGATAADLRISNVTAADAGRYDVVVTSACGSATSNASELTVRNATEPPVSPDARRESSGTESGTDATETPGETNDTPTEPKDVEGELTSALGGGACGSAAVGLLTVSVAGIALSRRTGRRRPGL